MIRKPTASAGTVTVTGLPERNFRLRGSGPIGVRIEASASGFAVVPHEFDHGYHHKTPPDGGGGVRLSIEAARR